MKARVAVLIAAASAVLPAASLHSLPWRMASAHAAPLPLYDNARDSTVIAPIPPSSPTLMSSVSPCGGFAVACSAAPVSPHRVLPFDYGLAVSGTVGGCKYGAFSGVGAEGWVKPKDLPVTLYFDVERYQPLGRTR